MKQNKKTIIITSIAIVIAIPFSLYAYSFLFNRHATPLRSGRIPYIMNEGFNKTLNYYINTYPSRYILALKGPPRSGKSRIMNMISQDENRFVINVDAGKSKTIEDFYLHLKMSIIQGLSKLNTKSIKSSTDDSESKSDLMGTILRTIDRSIENGFKETPVHDFFNLIEDAHSLHPIILCHNYQKIKLLGAINDPSFGEKLIAAIQSTISRRDMSMNSFPIIIEVDQIDHYIQNILLLETEEISNNDNSIFSLIEFRKILNAFGGHPGTLSNIFDSLRFGIKLDDSIQNENLLLKEKLERANATKSQIKAICSKARGDFSNLISAGLIQLADDGTALPINKAVQKLLCV